MRLVERPATPPPVLAQPEFVRMRQEWLQFLRLDPRRRIQTRPPDRHLPPSEALSQATAAAFQDKCAFCEGHGRLQPYRFRPTSNAMTAPSEFSALHYGWLADIWQNLYPRCPGCMPTRPELFPLEGQRQPMPTASEYDQPMILQTGLWPGPIDEQPMLLDPCADDPVAHLRADPDGRLIPLTPRAELTITQFHLNRPDLVARRRDCAARHFTDPDRATAPVNPAQEFAGFLMLLSQARQTTGLEAAGPEAGAAPVLPPPLVAATTVQPPPSLVEISITGYKALEQIRFRLPEVQPDPLAAPACLILGENAAGKSSILEAVTLALLPEDALDALELKPQQLLLDAELMGGAPRAQQDAQIGLRFRRQNGRSFWRRLTITDKGFKARGPLPHDFKVFAYGAYRHFLTQVHDWTPTRQIVSLFRSDNLLSNPEAWLLALDQHRFDEVVATLRLIFGPSNGFERIEREAARCLVITRPDGADHAESETRTPLSAVSSGFRTVLALCCDMMRWLVERAPPEPPLVLGAARGLLIVDEIEAHMHPRWKVTIMAGLRRAFPGMTLLITTHDPLCVRGMADGEVFVLRRIPGEQADTDLPIKVERLTELPDVSALTIEQLLKSDLFALYDTDDPQGGADLARLADALVALRGGGVEELARIPQAQDLIGRFRDEVTSALPVGLSQVARLVQDAVADFVIAQQRLPAARRQKLHEQTRARIVALLEQALVVGDHASR